MADLTHVPERVDYRTDPTQYRHWTLSVEGAIAPVSYTHLTLPTTPYV